MRTKTLITLAAVGVASLAALLGGVLSGSKANGQAPVARSNAVEVLAADFAPRDTRSLAAQLEARVRANPQDVKGLTLLGLAYLQRVRETGDPAFYARSESAFERALGLEPNEPLAVTGLAALAASRHRFEEARRLAERARRVALRSAAPLGVLGDALIELGRYNEAVEVIDRMVSLKPYAASYARVSYARELLGDIPGAFEAMRRAVVAAGPAAEGSAWALSHLGNLYLETGRLSLAELEFRRALSKVPEYAHALGGLARAAAWRGKPEDAARLYSRALASQPLPEFAVGLGDAYSVLGQPQQANKAYARGEELEDAFAAAGGMNQLETALFDLDHGRKLKDALARAREGWRNRPSVEGEHVLAWALYKNDRCSEARAHSVRALRLGTKDWGAMLHRSLIEACLGNEDAARAFRQQALAVNRYALVAFGQAAP